MVGWMQSLYGSALSLTVAVTLLAVTVWSLARALRQMRHVAYRLLLIIGTPCYLVATLAMLFPPVMAVNDIPVLLVSAGSSASLVDSSDASLFVMQDALDNEALRGAVNTRARSTPDRRVALINTPDDILSIVQPDAIVVGGPGLPAADWFGLDPAVTVQRGPEQNVSGLIEIQAATTIDVGHPYRVDASVALLDDASESLQVQMLDSADTVLASTPLPTGLRATLEIQGLPIGAHVLRLAVVDTQQDTVLFEEPVAVNVRRPALARTLVLQSAPSFDVGYLVRWLGRSGASVAIRNQVSDGRFLERAINQDPVSLESVNGTLLDSIDFVVVDARAASQMPDTERRALFDSQAGHGVLLVVNDAEDLAAAQALFPDVITQRSEGKSEYRLPSDNQGETITHTRLDVALDSQRVSSVIEASDGTVIVGVIDDAPNTALSLLSDSYKIHSSGDEIRYSRFWSELVRRVARPAPRNTVFVPNDAPIAGQRLQLCAAGTDEQQALDIEAPNGHQVSLALHGSTLTPGLLCGWYWPRTAGWLKVQFEQHTVRRYVYPRSARRAVTAANAIVATRSALNAPVAVGQGSAAGNVPGEPVSRRRVLLAWLLSALVVWGVQRLGQPS